MNPIVAAHRTVLPTMAYMSAAGSLCKLLLLIILFLPAQQAASDDYDFVYNGFQSANLSLSGSARVSSDGLLRLTDDQTGKYKKGYAFHPTPLRLKNSSSSGGGGGVVSFSTHFVFAVVDEHLDVPKSQGFAFVLSPSVDLPYAFPAQYMGLSNTTNDGDESNHLVAVELDTGRDRVFGDADNNHVGIDVNGLRSVNASPASVFSYEAATYGFQSVTLAGGKRLQLWIDYDGAEKRLDVSLAPFDYAKPSVPLLSSIVNISEVILDHTYVGFSASTGYVPSCFYVLGWRFTANGQRPRILDLSQLPIITDQPRRRRPWIWSSVGRLLIAAASILLLAIGGAAAVFLVRRRLRYAELIEDWELSSGDAAAGGHRFQYKELFLATKGFKASELLGAGGFGRVYKGTLPTSGAAVAVKKVRQGSSQGLREFVAEVASVGRLRHRNIVRLLGYCRRRGELLLVYELMQHASLDKLLFDQPSSRVSWGQRFQIVKGIAAAVFYLHEGWERVVVHRDIKASNVLLGGELNARLGDFGLSRMYDHGGDHPGTATTRVVAGTLGYIAPELVTTRKASTATDVFAFGVFMLEVACGRRPIEPRAEPPEKVGLVEWVLQCWRGGAILEAVDPNLGGDYVTEEAEMVLKVGLLCANLVPGARPTMRHVMRLLDGDAPLPALPPNDVGEGAGAEPGILLEAFSAVDHSVLSTGR